MRGSVTVEVLWQILRDHIDECIEIWNGMEEDHFKVIFEECTNVTNEDFMNALADPEKQNSESVEGYWNSLDDDQRNKLIEIWDKDDELFAFTSKYNPNPPQ